MTKARHLGLLLSPSLVSGPICVLLALLVLGSAGWAYITDSQLFYDQLFGAYGAVTVAQVRPYSIDSLQGLIFSGPLTYYVLLFAGSIIAGVTVYIVLESISRVVYGTSLFLREVHSDRATARQAAQESLARLVLRIAGLVAWSLYWLVFINLLVPTSLVALEQSLEALSMHELWALVVLALAFATLVVSIHLHVTFARLVYLRIRLFGGYDAELSRLEEHD